MKETSQLLALDGLEFIEGAYALALGRAVDPKGMRDYLQRLESGTPKEQILNELRASDEGQMLAARVLSGQAGAGVSRTLASLLGIRDDASFVDRCHIELTGQPPTPAQASEALQYLEDGRQRLVLMRVIRASTEGQAHVTQIDDVHKLDLSAEELSGAACSLSRMLDVTDEAFVYLAYRGALGREPDQAGRSNYLALVREGTSRVEVLQQLQSSEEGKAHGNVIEGLPEVVRRQSGVRRRMAALARKVVRRARARPKPIPTESIEPPLPAPVTVSDVAAPNTGRPEREIPLAKQTQRESPLVAVTRGLSRRLAVLSASPVNSSGYPSIPSSSLSPMTHNDHLPLTSVEQASPALQLRIEGFVGAFAHGWSFRGDKASPCSVIFGGRIIGRLLPKLPRRDVQVAFSLATDSVGFSSLLGGLLQFSALVPGCDSVQLEHAEADSEPQNFPLTPHLNEALSFSPMMSFARLPSGTGIGRIIALNFAARNELVVLFEAEVKSPEGLDRAFLDVYQEMNAGRLERLARFSIELGGQLTSLEVKLFSRSAPILLVATDAQRNILLTDCVPLPELFEEKQRPLVEYHSLLANGQSAFDVAAKVSRSHLNAAILRGLSPETPRQGPSRDSTAVILYAREQYDFTSAAELDSLLSLSDHAGILLDDGSLLAADGASSTLEQFLARSACKHVLFVDVRVNVRPDFWAVLESNSFRMGEAFVLAHWQSVWLEGLARPYVAKPGLLLHPALNTHPLIPLRAALVERQGLAQAVAADPQHFRSGSLQLEKVFGNLDRGAIVNIPVVLDSITLPSVPAVTGRFASEHVVLPTIPSETAKAEAEASVGISVIINYRNSVEETVTCIEALRAQTYAGPLEVILVNNCSSPESVFAIESRARAILGADAVQTIDYPQRFNHSAQCNIAAKVARHDLLLMLSNDAVLLSSNALALVHDVALIPWVATVGFRLIGGAVGSRKLQSLGLASSLNQGLFHGGSPLGTSRPPSCAIEFTQESLGNTFAAVLIRRELYFELGGLDEEAFPTNYNDVDFCCRALQHGYRHIVVGSAVVEHVGRGSREMDLDLPLDQRILDRCPDMSILTGIGYVRL